MDERLRALMLSLQAVASSATAQPALFPSLTRTPDRLARDFETARTAVMLADDVALTDRQREMVDGVAGKFGEMSRYGREFDAALWTEAALPADPQWDEVRRLAAAALEAFEWPSVGAGASWEAGTEPP